jgi:hypothetical protein
VKVSSTVNGATFPEAEVVGESSAEAFAAARRELTVPRGMESAVAAAR